MEMETAKLSPWRLNSPFAQATVISLIMFCCSGMNSTVLALGAGGSRVELLPVINRAGAVGLAVAAVAAVFRGTLTNKLGPRVTLLIATSGYPSFVVSLWVIDNGLAGAKTYLWIATIWHGISVAALYPAAGYVVAAYSPEHLRGRYIASMWASQLLGGVFGSCIVLGITAGTGNRSAGVPTAVYAAIVAVQSLGFMLAVLLKSPESIRRNNGQAIATFQLLTWREEIVAMRSSFLRPETLLLAIALFASQMPFSLIAALNSYFFSARTRALATLCYGITSLIGTVGMSVCDWSFLGRRRRRSLILGLVTLLATLATWTSLLWFLATHASNRHKPSPKLDWTDSSSSAFPALLAIFLVLGLSYAMYLTYHVWLCSSFTNEPGKLGRQYGYLTAMRMTGLAVAFGFDSSRVPFLTEAVVYFVLLVAGSLLALASSWSWLKDTRYGDRDEEGVIVPREYKIQDAPGERTGVSGRSVSSVDSGRAKEAAATVVEETRSTES